MRILVSLAMVGMVLLAGCKGKFPTAPVEGVVTWKGKPLKHGTVVFFHETAPVSGAGTIGPDGRYKLDAPVGNCRVAIQAREQPPADLPKEKQTQAYYLGLKSEIPDRYEDHMRNGLHFTVKEGNNTADWKLVE
jgi:hypothetical protein